MTCLVCDAGSALSRSAESALAAAGIRTRSGHDDDGPPGGFDCVLLDFDNLTFARNFRRIVARRAGAAPAIVVMAGQIDVAGEARLRAAGADGFFFTFPFNARALISTIIGAVDRRRALRHGELVDRRLASIVDTSKFAIVCVDPDMTVTAWNAGAELTFGYSKDEAIGRRVDELIPGDETAEDQKRNHAMSLAGEFVFREGARRARSGARIPVEISAAPLTSATGAIEGVSIVYRDISERIKASATIADNEAFTRSILESSPDCLKVINPDGKLRFMNANGQCLMEIDDFAAVAGKEWSSLWPAETHASIKAAMAAALDGRETRFEAFCPTAKGSPKWWDVMVRPVLDASGACTSILAASRDVTESRLKGAALAESEARLRHTLTAAHLGSFQFDFLAGLITWDEHARALFGATPDEETVVFSRMVELVHPEDRDILRAASARARDPLGDGFYSLQHRISSAEGSLRWLEVRGQIEFAGTGPDRSPVVSRGIVRDVTELRLARDRQAILAEELAHRGKNVYAVVQSIVNRTLATAGSIAGAREAIVGRLEALAQAQAALIGAQIESAPLETIVRNELAAFGARVHVEGPGVALHPKAAQTFGLVIHELATNAAKHGSLSIPQGRVAATWAITRAEGGEEFAFKWREIGGPPARAPRRKSFGFTLISRVAAAEFGCAPRLDYGEEGFSYAFVAPLAKVGLGGDGLGLRGKIRSAPVLEFHDAWYRVSQKRMPSPRDMRTEGVDTAGALVVGRFLGGENIVFESPGRALVERVPGSINVEEMLTEPPEGVVRSWLSCARSREPVYTNQRFDRGDGYPFVFERLIVPLSDDGANVTHAAGISVFMGDLVTVDPEISKERHWLEGP